MNTKYSDLIEIRESAIAFKIHPENGDWRDFIPNNQFNEVLHNVINSVYNNNKDYHKPFWIAGTYGSGKSHAGAVIKHLLCDDAEKIREYVETEYKDKSFDLLRSMIFDLRSKKRLLPVSLYGMENMAAAEDLPFILQTKIVEALKDEDFTFEVQTDFDNYIVDIEKDNTFWSMIIERDDQLKASAPNTSYLIDKLKKHDIPIIHLIKEALRRQNRIVPLQGDSLEKWIFEIQDKLAEQGKYNGLFILWDELTDVLRSPFGISILGTLQRISETMMMSQNNSYFLFISHQSALDTLEEQEREKTKGRYHYMTYAMEMVSAYKIMSRKFKFDENNPSYLQKRKIFIEPNEKLYEDFSHASTSTSPEETIHDLYNLFPIHPGTANLATHYAREAGSSSRSVFEFIGANPAIQEFMEDEGAYANNRMITADFLWDFVVGEFNQKPARFAAVTERYNSRRHQVETEGGPDHYAVFKSILLLNALNNIANNVLVTPSMDNIAKLFKGTHIENNLEEILNFLNDNDIIQRAPGDQYPIQFTSLPIKKIEEEKNKLKDTEYKYIWQVVNFGTEADNLLKSNFSQVTRPIKPKKYSLESNEHILLSKIENERKNYPLYEIFVALLFARNSSELSNLKTIVHNATINDHRFDNTLFVIYETPFGDDNYNRFIDYQANASVAQIYNSNEQASTYRDLANGMIKEWIQKLQHGMYTYYFKNSSGSDSANKIALTINSVVAPTIFSYGPDSYDLLRSKSSKTFWEKKLARNTVKIVLTSHTKTEICDHCKGQFIHMTLLLQDSVDENLNWNQDINTRHPLKLVVDFIDQKLSSVNKNIVFNIGETLKELSLPPFGLFQCCACMGMVAFSMRKYAGQIFDTNGTPKNAIDLADAVIAMFQYWESNKKTNNLDVMFETKESRKLCDLFVKKFQLNELSNHDKISSLTDARWALVHDYIPTKNYPLWSLKYATDFEPLRNLIDKIVKICNDTDFRSNSTLLEETLSGMGQFKFELDDLLKKEGSFQNGFVTFIQGVAQSYQTQLNNEEIFSAINGIRQFIQAEIGLWTEEEVKNAFTHWRMRTLEDKRKIIINPSNENQPKIDGHHQKDEEIEAQRGALNKVNNINDVEKAKDILRKIIERANYDLLISLINEFDA